MGLVAGAGEDAYDASKQAGYDTHTHTHTTVLGFLLAYHLLNNGG